MLHTGRFDGFVWFRPTAISPDLPPASASKVPTFSDSGNKIPESFRRGSSCTRRTCCQHRLRMVRTLPRLLKPLLSISTEWGPRIGAHAETQNAGLTNDDVEET